MDWRAGFRLFLVVFGLAFSAPASPALQGERDTLAEMLVLPLASGLTGAKDAPRFAWVETAAGVRNVWFAERGQPARQVTSYREDDGVPLYDVTLSSDGKRLAFVRGGDGEFPDEDLPNAGPAATPPPQQIFMAALNGGAPVSIGEGHSPSFAPTGDRLAFTREGDIWLWDGRGPARKIASIAGEVGRLQWSPDGSRLLFIDLRATHSFIGLLQVAEGRLTYLEPGLGYSIEPTFSPDGSRVAFIRYFDPPAGAAPDSGPYWSLHVADVSTGAARHLWIAPRGAGGRYMGTRSRNLFWSATNEIIFPWEHSGWLHPYAIDAAQGGTPRELTPGNFEVETFLLSPDKRSLIYAANADDLNRRHVWQRPLAGGGAVRLTSGEGTASYPSFAGNALAIIATDAVRPAYPAVVGRTLTPLGRVVTAGGFTAPESVRFQAEDGVEVHGQLFRGKGSGKRPAIVYVHGGPRRQMLSGFHPSGYYSNAYITNQHLAAQGYDVLSVNYRSGTGYGQAFRDAPGAGREGAAEYRDILAAGRWLAARSDVDPQRIGIWGGSWGGYLTALALARDSDLFKVGVDFHGVHTLLRPVPDSLSPDAQAAARQLQWQSSPMASIDQWRSPVLLIHGDDDQNVAFSQSVLLARELAARRIPFEELVFPNERHGFLRHANWLESLRATERFLNATLRP